jgi:hypothetical protein
MFVSALLQTRLRDYRAGWLLPVEQMIFVGGAGRPQAPVRLRYRR